MAMKLTNEDFVNIQKAEIEELKTALNTTIEKLAAYEDTGLTPEEINGLCEMDKRSRMAKMLRWEEAEADGRLVVLPCKAGDTVYTMRSDGTACPHEIRRIEINKNGAFACSGLWFPFSDFGQTVFIDSEPKKLTIEELEKN